MPCLECVDRLDNNDERGNKCGDAKEGEKMIAADEAGMETTSEHQHTGWSKKHGNICFLCHRKTVQFIYVIFLKHALRFMEISLKEA